MQFNKVIPRVGIHKGVILMMLLHGKRIANKELYFDIDSCASGARIFELRADGWEIDDVFVYQRTKEGKDVRIKRYFITRDNIIEYLKNEAVRKFLASAEIKYDIAS